MHEDFVQDAIEMVNEDGRDAVLNVLTKTGEDWDPVITSTPQTIKVIQQNFKITEADGVAVKASDKIFFTGNTVVITTDMTITDGGVTYEIKAVIPIKPGETVIGYSLLLRL